MFSPDELDMYIRFAQSYEKDQRSVFNDITASGTISASTSGSSATTASSATPDPHAVPRAEAQHYYAGLHSEPVLLYRTGKERWAPPTGPDAPRYLKELCEVFDHPIVKAWNHDLGCKVIGVMDASQIQFTTIDLVRFKTVNVNEAGDAEGEEGAVVGPVTIWIGVPPESTTATAAHDAAQGILALLKDHCITDVDIDFRESLHVREVRPQLLERVKNSDPHPFSYKECRGMHV